jgi:3-(3-hydroxy-phenyl)propionate hydroxylase
MVRASYLIGCDGAGSTVRRQLGLPFEGSMYGHTFMLTDARVDGPLRHDAVHYFCSPRGVVVMIGLPGGRFRVFTSAPLGLLDTGPDLALLQQLVDERGPGGLRLFDDAWTSTFEVHARHAERYRVGRVFLAGDAAHIHSPAGGQGLNTGVGDAHNLAWKLALVHRGAVDLSVLDTYEVERAHVARSVIRLSDQQTRAWLTTRAPQIALRDARVRLASASGVLQRLYVPQLTGMRTRYPSPSPVLSRPLRGGRRRVRAASLVPDVPVRVDGAATTLRRTLGVDGYTVLLWTPDGHVPVIGDDGSAVPSHDLLTTLALTPTGALRRPDGPDSPAVPSGADRNGALRASFGPESLAVLVRPDHHVDLVVTRKDVPVLGQRLAELLPRRSPACV